MPEELDELFTAVSEELSDIDDSGDSEPVVVPTGEDADSGADNLVDDQGPADEIEGTDAEDTDNQDGSGESFDWEAYADQLIPVRVNGVDQMVSLREARDGFMRHQDYTQKTTEVADLRKMAQWAQEVQEAWAADPRATLEAFANAYQVNLGEQKPEKNVLDGLDEDIRPWAEQTMQVQNELAQARQQLAEIQQRALLEDVRQEVSGLQNKFGEAFDPEASLRLAAQKNIRLEDAHWLLMAQRQYEGQVTSAKVDDATAVAAAKAKAEAEAAKQQAKLKASSTQTRSFKASEIPADDFKDIGELAEMIFAQSGS